MRSLLVLLFTFSLAVLHANAQTNTKSDSWERSYSEAQKALNNAEYHIAIEKAIAAEELLNEWKPEVSLVKIHALDNLTQINDYADSDLTNSLINELDKFIRFNRSKEESNKVVVKLSTALKALPVYLKVTLQKLKRCMNKQCSII